MSGPINYFLNLIKKQERKELSILQRKYLVTTVLAFFHVIASKSFRLMLLSLCEKRYVIQYVCM